LTAIRASILSAQEQPSSNLAAGRAVRVALLTASPVYTRTPLYARIAADPRIDLTVIYASNGGVRPVSAGYRDLVSWDVDLLRGYSATFLKRANRNPIDGHFLSFRDLDILSMLEAGKYEVLWLWGYNYLTHQLAAWNELLRRRPVVFHENQTLLDHRPIWKRAVKRAFLSVLFPRGRALYVGTENYRWFRHYNVPADRLYFAPYAIDNERLQSEAKAFRSRTTELSTRLGLRPESRPVILTVSRLVPDKQPLLLLEAFRRLRQQRSCSLLFIGSGVLQQELTRRVQEQGIPDVHIAGFVNQSTIAQAYATADIFVLPSVRRETWGLAVNEAMNFSLPIIVSKKAGCASDLVREGVNGYVVSPGDVYQLKDRLERLVSSPHLRSEFGEASLQMIGAWNYETAACGVTQAIADSVGVGRWIEAASRADQEQSR